MSLNPQSIAEASDIIRLSRINKKPLIPAGGRNRLNHWGGISKVENQLLGTEKLKKIISIEPENLLAIVEAGLTPEEIRPSLEEAGLYWPVSGLGNRSLGAIMAEGAASLENMARGTMADWVLGTTFIEPSGRIISSGGRTLKNVSGYDLTRFQWKAWGTLGLSVVFILKCLPRPEVSKVYELEFTDGRQAAEAAENVIKSRIFPQSLHLVFKERKWKLLIWISGFEEFVAAQGQEAIKAAGGSQSAIHVDAIDFWNQFQLSRPLAGEGSGWRLGSRVEILALAARLDALNESGGLTGAALDIGGGQAHVTLKAANEDFFTRQSGLKALAPSLEGAIYQRLKEGLDPDDLFFPAIHFKNYQGGGCW